VFLSNLFNRAVHAIGLEPLSYKFSVPLETEIAIDKFFNSISDLTVESSNDPENAKRVVDNFEQLLRDLKLYNSLHALSVLKKEKGEADPLRANAKTPNIFHEIRNCAHILGMIKNGKIEMEAYESAGGLDADLPARLRHDSIEDKAKTKTEIYAGMEKNLYQLVETGEINEATEFKHRVKATIAANNTDYMTRKDADIEVIDIEETNDSYARISKNENGRIKKILRFGGDVHEYFIRMLQSPLALLPKYSDRIDNVGTRHGIDIFILEKNHKYARETRHIYGTFNFDERAKKMWPAFRKAIRASDAMLGIQLRVLEGINQVKENGLPNKNVPFEYRLDEYLPHALSAYNGIPQCLHPISVMLNSLSSEKDPNVKFAVMNFIKPPIQAAQIKQNLSEIGGVPLMMIKKDFTPFTHQ